METMETLEEVKSQEETTTEKKPVSIHRDIYLSVEFFFLYTQLGIKLRLLYKKLVELFFALVDLPVKLIHQVVIFFKAPAKNGIGLLMFCIGAFIHSGTFVNVKGILGIPDTVKLGSLTVTARVLMMFTAFALEGMAYVLKDARKTVSYIYGAFIVSVIIGSTFIERTYHPNEKGMSFFLRFLVGLICFLAYELILHYKAASKLGSSQLINVTDLKPERLEKLNRSLEQPGKINPESGKPFPKLSFTDLRKEYGLHYQSLKRHCQNMGKLNSEVFSFDRRKNKKPSLKQYLKKNAK